jgi:hypothetical protein
MYPPGNRYGKILFKSIADVYGYMLLYFIYLMWLLWVSTILYEDMLFMICWCSYVYVDVYNVLQFKNYGYMLFFMIIFT